MKKIEKIEDGLLKVGVVSSIIALGLFGIRKIYDKGFQTGCEILFAAMIKEFPDIDHKSFYEKYHG